MKYVPEYNSRTSIKHGECPTGAAVAARNQLLKDAGLVVSNEEFLPNKGYVPVWEGKELSQDEMDVLCLIELKERDEVNDLISEYKEQYLRVNNRVPNITRNGSWIIVNGDSVRRFQLEQYLYTLKGRKSYLGN